MLRPIASSLALLITLAATPALSATFTVDTTADTTDVSPGDGFCGTPIGPCSLRAAVQETNALAGADDIILPAGTYLLTLTGPAEDASASGDLDVHDSLTITGAGAASTIIDAGGIARVIEAGVNSPSPPRTLTISGVTIRGGHVQSNESCDGIIQLPGGDGICANTMALVMSDAVVEQNAGQGVFVLGSLSLTRVSVRNNADLGVFTIFGPSTIVESTISDNAGGGLTLDPGSSNAVRNSTLSGNGSTGLYVGGGCEPPQIPCPSGGVTLDNVTITGHSGVAVNDRFVVFPSGGSFAIPVTVRNSVLAGNGSECDSELVSGGYNLLQTLTGCTVTGDTTGNVVGMPAVLGPLANNGGPTQTRALLAGSPAINAGNPAAPGSGGGACLATDQRGVARPGGPRCDMGAFESSCGDGIVDAGETCDGGVCCSASCAPSDATCGACLVCSAGTACVVPTAGTCAAPAPTKSSVTIADKPDPTKDGAHWKWTGTSGATKATYGSPTTSGGTGYALCLYDGAGGSFLLLDAPAGCDQNACWEERPNAFKLTSGPGSQGKFKATLKAGLPGKLQLKTKGTAFDVPGLPLALPVRVRLSRTDTGACWDADYGADIRKNTAESFRAKSN